MDWLSDILETNVTNWNENKSSNTSTALAMSIKGFNHEAERGIPITEEYNKLHITDEGQKHYLLLLVKQFQSPD